MREIINLTPHDINVVDDNGNVHTFPRSGTIARVDTHTEYHRGWEVYEGEDVWIPLAHERDGEVIDLPEPKDGVDYIVSARVRNAVPHRKDVFSPGGLVRDDDGKVVGCSCLVGNPWN